MSASTRTAIESKAHAVRTVSIIGTGSYLPKKILSNAELEKIVDTSDEWISSRTGIHERRIATPEECTSHLGAEAAHQALENAGISASEVDLMICATITPDMPFPCTACLIQEKIKAPQAVCFDIEAACSGFVFAIETGRQFIMSGTFNTVLVIAAEKLSSIVDWKDRNTCILFGDGAGAAVLRHVEGARGIIVSSMGSNGAHSNLLCMPGGGARNPSTVESIQSGLHYLKMVGKDVFKHAILSMTQTAIDALKRSHLSANDIACIIPHQANMRIIQGLAERLHVSPDKFYVNLQSYGNMSAASVAVALDEAARKKRFKRGDYVLMIAFGAGFTWGASVVQW